MIIYYCGNTRWGILLRLASDLVSTEKSTQRKTDCSNIMSHSVEEGDVYVTALREQRGSSQRLKTPSRWSLINPLSNEERSGVTISTVRQGLWVLSPVDLSVLVKVFQAFKNVLQHRGDAGLIQHTRLVLASRDDVLDHVQHGAWMTITGDAWLIKIKKNPHLSPKSERNENYTAADPFKIGWGE